MQQKLLDFLSYAAIIRFVAMHKTKVQGSSIGECMPDHPVNPNLEGLHHVYQQ